MKNIQTLSCPQCGGSNLDELSQNKVVCRYCGSISLISEDRNVLEYNGWRCLSCRYINDTNSKFCGKCGTRITRHCPKCGKDIQHFLKNCTSCGYEFIPGEFTIYECIGGVGGLLFANRITLSNKRICCLSDNSLCSGYFEVLLSDIGKLKVKGTTYISFKNRIGNNKIRIYFNEPSKLGEHLKRLL